MLIPPNDWTNDRPGGYLLNEACEGMIWFVGDKSGVYRGKSPGLCQQSQRTGFRLNPSL